ncbi:uncharacterized protein DS421_11g345290 [Arachis hypogaea]|nr:uncharacterized protein DS421_11g345290 [Arachis hypogaea]
MQPPSRCHSLTCPATTAVASAPLRCALLQRHPNASIPSMFIPCSVACSRLHSAAVSPLFNLSSADVHHSVQPSPSSMKASAPSPFSIDLQNM